MKVTVEIKKSMARLNSRLDTSKELISKLEEQPKEIPSNVTKKWRFKNNQSLMDDSARGV